MTPLLDVAVAILVFIQLFQRERDTSKEKQKTVTILQIFWGEEEVRFIFLNEKNSDRGIKVV